MARSDGNVKSHITPLFWQHGEGEDILRDEIRKMNGNGIGSFIVESRPHPDYLGAKWWKDLDIIIDEAGKLGMKVWIFDDSAFPSGFGAGKIAALHPGYMKVYLKEHHIDAIGPLAGSSFYIDGWLDPEDKLISVSAAKRTPELQDSFDADTVIKLTANVKDGILYWDLPEGAWRIFIFICTRNGGEEHTRNYINPLMKEAVGAFIETIYETHYIKYPDEFGKTIAGFFTDEPRFGSAASYSASIGRYPMVLPFSPELLSSLDNEYGGDFEKLLPCLWYDGGEKPTSDARFIYMSLVSRLFGENFSMQTGDWCRRHNVKLIGHVVEENGAHARLGYGAGHFFRAVSGQDHSGLDIVYNVWPGYETGSFSSPFFDCDARFNFWGITKMASSAGHIDPKKDGVTVCEVFGAYGWQEGLKLMKWLTDHICVRGVNFLIPHAFSPKFPDYDCPPHFYARGHNPQWRYFGIWSAYANRVCDILTGGTHIAPVAVLYHAEAEWGGEYEPFEKAVKILMQNQLDCDIIPVDTFVDPDAVLLNNGYFTVNKENFKTLIIPYSANITARFASALLRMAVNEIKIIFMTDYPASVYLDENPEYLLKKLREHRATVVSGYGDLLSILKNDDVADIETTGFQPTLRYYHYRTEDAETYFFTNEDKFKRVSTTVKFKENGTPFLYDAMNDKNYLAKSFRCDDRSTNVELSLVPFESIFVVFDKSNKPDVEVITEKIGNEDINNYVRMENVWKISTATAEEYPEFKSHEGISELCNISAVDVLPQFSGTIRYETTFDYKKDSGLDSVFAGVIDEGGKILLDLGDVYEIAEVRINGSDAGSRICPPYTFDITGLLKNGENTLQIYITNTLVKAMPSKMFDRYMPLEPSGLIGPVTLYY
ncbi:MAG: glycosylhydrolase-like jelly roll fold domain-containing protein [Saccharofermentanales bacterium]